MIVWQHMKLRLCQLAVSSAVEENTQKVLSQLDASSSDEWIIFPEGMISGYQPEKVSFIDDLDETVISKALDDIEKIVRQKDMLCIVGSALEEKDDWYNCSIILSQHQRVVYKKNNLSTLDRKHFAMGKNVEAYEHNGIPFGIQMCREVVFPEQWKILKKNGAQLFFHINNALKERDQVWEKVLVTRALENQAWVCSVNNAASQQVLPSMIINPLGEIVWQSIPQREEAHLIDIDLSTVSTQYLQQERTDLVEVIRKDE